MATPRVKKLSASAILGDTKKFFQEHVENASTDSVPVYTVVGNAKSYKMGSGQFGEYVEYKGSFEFINKMTGQSIKAPICFLPEVADGMVVAAMDANNSESTIIAMDVLMVKKPKSILGFDWSIAPLLEENAETDPLELLKNNLGIRTNNNMQGDLLDEQKTDKPADKLEAKQTASTESKKGK